MIDSINIESIDKDVILMLERECDNVLDGGSAEELYDRASKLLLKGRDTYFRCEGEGARYDHGAIRLFMRAAERGNGDAAYRLGLCYFWGRGVARDKKLWEYWLKKAADLCCYEAQTQLENFGVQYEPQEELDDFDDNF